MDSRGEWALAIARNASAALAAALAQRASGQLDGFCPPPAAAAAGGAPPAPSKFAFGWLARDAAAVAEINCSWTRQGQRMLGGLAFASCVADPKVDHMSRALTESGTYFNDQTVSELGAWRLCPPSAPFVIDVGLNLGSFTFTALQLGCHVIAFEPALNNIGRVARSLAANPELAARVHIVRNAVGAERLNAVPFVYAPANSGGSKIDARFAADPATQFVPQVVLDDLFFPPLGNEAAAAAATAAGGYRALPCSIVNPFTGRALQPQDVGFVKIDAEGYDLRALHGARRSLRAGLASNGGLMIEFHRRYRRPNPTHPPLASHSPPTHPSYIPASIAAPGEQVCDPYATADFLESEGFRYLHSDRLGVRGSRWLTGARLQRVVHAARTRAPCTAAGKIEHVLEGLWLRGEMLRVANETHTLPATDA